MYNMGLSLIQLAVNGYDNNFSYIVADTATKNAVVVDPSGDLDLVLDTLDEQRLDLVGILITHTHHDHIDQLAELLRSYTVPVYVHKEGEEMIISQGPIRAVNDGDKLELGESWLQVLYTPGHINDAVCYLIPTDQADDGVPKVITGDTLFVGGCGRTNASGVRALYDSLERLKQLPPETEVYPGHDYGERPHSTIGYELEHNRYLLVNNFEEFKAMRLP